MFEPTSRYYNIDTGVVQASDGREIHYKRRRFLPRRDSMQHIAEITIEPGERLDLIASRTVGTPEDFWKLCDANNTLNPFDLIEPGARIRVAVQQVM